MKNLDIDDKHYQEIEQFKLEYEIIKSARYKKVCYDDIVKLHKQYKEKIEYLERYNL